jgi:hypothetical protein
VREEFFLSRFLCSSLFLLTSNIPRMMLFFFLVLFSLFSADAQSTGSYYSIFSDPSNVCLPGCEMNAPASVLLSGGILQVGFQGQLGNTCNGASVNRAVSNLQFTNVVALPGSAGFYQGTRTSQTYCFYLDSHLLALPQQPGMCPDGPPFRPFCSTSGGVVNRIDVLVIGNPTPTVIPVSLPAGPLTATLTIPRVVAGSCGCIVNQTFTITTTGVDSLSLTAGAVLSNGCGVSASSSFTITNIVTRESPGYFFGTTSSGTVCFIYVSQLFVYGGSSCPTGPFRSYCGAGAGAGSLITYSIAQTGTAPVGPPLSGTTSSSGSNTEPPRFSRFGAATIRSQAHAAPEPAVA